MSDMLDYVKKVARQVYVKNAADGCNVYGDLPPVLPPADWEEVRLEMQRRLRIFSGEPDAIVHFEFPGMAST